MARVDKAILAKTRDKVPMEGISQHSLSSVRTLFLEADLSCILTKDTPSSSRCIKMQEIESILSMLPSTLHRLSNTKT